MPSSRIGAPIEPPPTPWDLPDPATAGPGDLVAVGGDLEPGTLLAAYRRGLFPMPVEFGGPIGWWSPDPRGVLPLDGFRMSRSLRRSRRRFVTTIDRAFADVIVACADPSRPYPWIDERIIDAYLRLHELGWAHSVETWSEEGELVGGLYGVAIGGFFAGESMFHRVSDASKVALARLVDELRAGGARLLDVQWVTPHLASLGAVAVPRPVYLDLLRSALAVPLPAGFIRPEPRLPP